MCPKSIIQTHLTFHLQKEGVIPKKIKDRKIASPQTRDPTTSVCAYRRPEVDLECLLRPIREWSSSNPTPAVSPRIPINEDREDNRKAKLPAPDCEEAYFKLLFKGGWSW